MSEIKRFNFQLDMQYQEIQRIGTLVQNDFNSNLLIIKLTKENQAYDLTNIIDDDYIISGENFDVVDTENGIISFLLPDSVIENKGTYDGEVQIVLGETEKRLTSSLFQYEVRGELYEKEKFEYVGKGLIMILYATATLDYVVRPIITTKNYMNESINVAAGLSYIERPIITTQNNFDESLTANANINYIVRGDFNSLDLVNPKELNLTTITFQLSPEYWTIYNYQASDFELVGAMGTTLTATAISYDADTKTFTLTFPSIEHINPAPDLKTRLYMRSGTITNVFGTVLDEAYVIFETSYQPLPRTQDHTESLTATATLSLQVKDINGIIIIEF